MTDDSEHTWCLLLAAGASIRFGSPKAMARWGSGTLLSSALATASEVCGPRVTVVTGAHHDKIVPALKDALSVFNGGWPKGMGGSIRAGAAAVLAQDPAARLMLILPVDQPFVSSGHLRELGRRAAARDICLLTGKGDAAGPPAAVPRRFFDRLLALSGARGLKSSLTPCDYETLESAHSFGDADTPGELARLAAGISPHTDRAQTPDSRETS
jgi:molybdenum cofactor cytidylyltransferase